MKLYINALSPNVRRVRLTAAVLGLNLEEKKVDFGKGEQKGPELLALNGNGQVPTLVDGAFVLSESRAIMQYLASKKPESGLLPRDEQARADITRWQFWDASQFAPHVGTIAFQRVLKPMFGMGEPDAAKIDEGLQNFRRFAAVLDKHLEGRRYIVGTSLTIADLTIASTLMYSQQSELPLAEFPNIQGLCSRIGEMDAWKATNP